MQNNDDDVQKNQPRDPNESYGPFHNERGQRITFSEWFHGGEPIKKKVLTGPLIGGLSSSTFQPVFLITMVMYLATSFHADFDSRLYVSTADLDTPVMSIFRSFGSLFIHSGFPHLGSNLLLFIPFGWLLRNYFGFFTFPILSVLAGVLTNWLTIYIYATQGYNSSLVGASGMVYAMVAQWNMLYLRWDRRYSLKERIIRALGVTMMLLIPTEYSPKTSYLAHALGFLIGVFFTIPFLIFREKKPDSPS